MANTKKVFSKGDKVQWKWMGHIVRGIVKKVYYKPVEMPLRGHFYKRNGSEEKPAYLITSDAGSDVLKSTTEISSTR